MTDLTPHDIHPWVQAGIGRIRFGVSIFPQPPDWRHFLSLVQQMETAGFDGYFAYDHPTANADCWTALSALAAVTSTIRLGLAVDCIYYRPPYLLARQAADVDRLSNGRLVLGLGIGHVKPEFAQMGIPFPPTTERLRGMDETIAIVRGLFTGQPFRFEGEQWSIETTGEFSASGATTTSTDPAGRRWRKSHSAASGAICRRLQHGRPWLHRHGGDRR